MTRWAGYWHCWRERLAQEGPTSSACSSRPHRFWRCFPQVIWLLVDAIKFVVTGAHGKYGDPAFALWDGLTAVDHAVATIRRVAPQGCTLYLLPGTWSTWDQLFPFDIAARLQT